MATGRDPSGTGVTVTVEPASPFPPLRMTDSGVLLCLSCNEMGRCKLGIVDMHILQPDPMIAATVRCPKSSEGGPGVAHGGWIASVFDDVLGGLPNHLAMPCVTG